MAISPLAAAQESSFTDDPNRISFELLGKGFLASLGYERQLYVDHEVVPIWGAGYEYRFDGGLLFRVGLAFFVIIPWPSLSFGYAF